MKIPSPKTPLLATLVVVALSGLLAGCGGSSSSTGIASFGITDAAVDNVARVQITIDALALKPQDGEAFTVQLATPLVITNLLDLQGGNAVSLLGPTTVPAGRYEWARLYVVPGGSDSFVIDNAGGTWDLQVPGQQGSNPNDRFVQLSSGFVVPVGGTANFMIDVDLRRALVLPTGSTAYFLRPALRITDDTQTGTIVGTFPATLMQGASCTGDASTGAGNAVYIYSDAGAATGDIYLDAITGLPLMGDNPLTAAPVHQNTDGTWGFRFDYVATGNYTLAFTCQANGDDPYADEETLQFLDATNVTVTTGATTSVSLP